jgi:hypothetical protein
LLLKDASFFVKSQPRATPLSPIAVPGSGIEVGGVAVIVADETVTSKKPAELRKPREANVPARNSIEAVVKSGSVDASVKLVAKKFKAKKASGRRKRKSNLVGVTG